MTRNASALSLFAVLLASPVAAQAPQAVPAPTPAPAAVAAPVAAAVAETPVPSTPAEVVRAATRKLDVFQAKEARALLEPVAARAPADPDVAIALGRLLEQEKKYPESESVLRRAAEAAPADARIPLQLGETLLRAKKAAEADAAFRKAAELAAPAAAAEPPDARALLVRGKALSRLRRYDEAIAALEKARGLDGGRAETLYEMGATRAFQQRWADAVALLTQSLQKESGMALGYYYRGLSQEKLGRKDLMVVDLDRFVKLAPSAPEAERARAILAAASR